MSFPSGARRDLAGGPSSPPCPVESFPALDSLSFLRAAFIQRCPSVETAADRQLALERLWPLHRQTAKTLGFSDPLAFAEQVHGDRVAGVDSPRREPIPAADGLITDRAGVCLAIYVADCAAVYLADRTRRAIGLVHAGKKGTQLQIVPKAIAAMRAAFGTNPADLVVQISPCIRPPYYELDFAAEIIRQAREAGVRDVFDCGTCTASNLERYYSYRREKGHTGRLLALAEITSRPSGKSAAG